VIDFEMADARLEVKTTRDPSSTHWFSHDQLALAELTDVTLASMIAVPSKAGETVRDMLERALRRLAETPVLAERVLANASRDRRRSTGQRAAVRPTRVAELAALDPNERGAEGRSAGRPSSRGDGRAALENARERSAEERAGSSLLSAILSRAT
jgi:hypothetical protein